MIQQEVIKSRYYNLLAGSFLIFAIAALYFDRSMLIVVPFLMLGLVLAWQHPRFVFMLLLLSLPFSFEYNFTPALGTDIPDEGLMLLTSFLFCCYWIHKPGLIEKKILFHPLLLLLAIHFIWIILTVLLSTDKLLSLKYLLAKSWYLGAFILAPLIVFRDKKRIQVAAILTATGMLIIAVIALFRHYRYDFNFADINQAVTPFFRNHVNYSAMLVCILPVFYAFFLRGANRKLRSLFICCIVLLLMALFFSYARGAWLALAAGALAWWLLKERLLVWSYIIMIVLVSTVFVWLQSKERYLDYAHDYRTTIFHKDFSQHLVATYKLKDVSTAERFYRWVAGIRMSSEYPLTGFGPNTFYDNYRPYTIPAYKTWVSDNREHSTVHNYFLLLLIEQGIPGLIFFLVLLGGMLYYAQYLYHRTKDNFYKTVSITCGVIVVMISILNFLSDLIETDKVGSIFFLCLSMLVMTDINTKKTSELPPDIQSIP